MLVKSFFAWMDEAGPIERADAADMLAHAYLAKALGGDSEAEVVAALTVVLDDPAPEVRRAVALVFAEADAAPRHIVLSLAQDQPNIAAILIARSPVLREADLVELAATVEGYALIAIAMRREVSALVSQALISRKNRDTLLMLVGNSDAVISRPGFEKIVADFGSDSRLREALLARTDLPPTARQGLMRAVAMGLDGFATSGGFLQDARSRKLMDETILTGTLAIIAREPGYLLPYVRYLRETEQLTASLVLRSVLGGNLKFLAASLTELLEMPASRVSGLLSARTDTALSALIQRSGLPEFLERPLIAAIRASRAVAEPTRIDGFDLGVIRAAQSACLDLPDEAGIRLLALLRRYEADAARSESLRLAESLRSEVRGQKLLMLQQGEALGLSAPAAEEAVIDLAASARILPKTTVAAPQEKLVGEDSDLAEIGYTDTDEDSWLLNDRNQRAPDLKSIIGAWKRERDMRYAVPEAQNSDFRRQVA